MSKESGKKVVVIHRFRASPERVFDAWLDPARAKLFFFATDTGEVVRVEIDPRVGGKFVLVDRRDGEDVAHEGEYVEIDRPRRLAFDFSVPKYTKDKTRVTIDITPEGSGALLTLTHEGVWDDYKERTEQGWTKMLSSLDRAIS